MGLVALRRERGAEMRKIVIGIAAALALTACARVQSNITSYSQIQSGYEGKTIAVVPYNDEQANSLEFWDFARRLDGRFAAKGLRPVDIRAVQTMPDLLAFFSFTVDNGQQVSRTYSIPTYGQTGVSSSHTTGTLNSYGNYGTYSGTTTYTPTYGITGYQTGTTTDTVYGRGLTLDIMRPVSDKDADKVYEATLASAGECGNMAAVMDSLLDALFEDFPKPVSGRVTVPFNGDC
jgi:hypothetical protein